MPQQTRRSHYIRRVDRNLYENCVLLRNGMDELDAKVDLLGRRVEVEESSFNLEVAGDDEEFRRRYRTAPCCRLPTKKS